MEMETQSWVGVAMLGLNLVLIAERVIGRLIRGKFSTHEELQEVDRRLTREMRTSETANNSAFALHTGKIADVKHMIELVERDIEGKPNFSDFAELKSEIADLKEKLAVSMATQEHVVENVQEIKTVLNRFIEKNGGSR